jgi:hypothetical protein
MAYLNKTTQVLKAILTNKGREKLAQGNFDVTHFALADDEVDYTLWDTAHPSGSDYYGTVIENLPLLEPVPNETSVMRYKLLRSTDHLDRSSGMKMATIGGTFNNRVNTNSGILDLSWKNVSNIGDEDSIQCSTNNLHSNSSPEAYSYTLLNTNIAFLYLDDSPSTAGRFAQPTEQSLRFRASQTLIAPSGNNTIKIKAKRITSTQNASKTSLIVTGVKSGATAALTIRVNYKANE